VTGAALVYSSSLIAAFLGGVLALFAPCCIVSLLPTFVGAALRQGPLRLPIGTALFAAGVAVVLLPVVLGIGALGSIFASYHRALYFGVAAVLIAIGFAALIGRGVTLPLPMLSYRVAGSGSLGEMFVLGAVSGVVSSCCAPVLAGVIVLSALAASPLGALGLGLSYVFGMVFPLFIAALVSNRIDLKTSLAKPFKFEIAGQPVPWTDVASGLIFLVMGALALVIAITDRSTLTPDALNAWSQKATQVAGGIAVMLGHMPLTLQVLVLAVLALVIAAAIYSGTKQSTKRRV
jgi:cytochrome c biogenesis protein CcdA